MAHGVSEKTEGKPEVEKASILLPLAVKEEEEVRRLHEAEGKAEQQVVEAQAAAAERARRLQEELKTLEKEILDRCVAVGEKEAAQIRAAGEKELQAQLKVWQARVPAAAEKLFQKIIRV